MRAIASRDNARYKALAKLVSSAKERRASGLSVLEGTHLLAAYLDLESGISRELLLNAAGRFEHYSTFGSKLTGKVALRYQPSKRLTLRGALSTGGGVDKFQLGALNGGAGAVQHRSEHGAGDGLGCCSRGA